MVRPRKRALAGRLLPALLALLLGACAPGRSPQPGPSTVVLVTIDTWRWDATGFLGARDPSPTPFLDRLAQDGLVASRAIAPVPLTGPSHWSMLTGRWPWRDGLRVNGDRPAPDHAPTLAQRLASAGWLTAAFVSCAALDHRLGFAAGFQHFDDRVAVRGGIADLEMSERKGEETVGAALAWIRDRNPAERVFLWVHLFEPHFPYEMHPGPFRGADAAYLSEVAQADRHVEALRQGLAEAGRPGSRALWVVLSDHGESLGDHGAESHGLLLHSATTRVPMLWVGPGIPRGRDAALASTVDVFATILDVLDLDAGGADGRSLLADPGARHRFVPLESFFGLRAFGLSPAVGLRTEAWLWEESPADHLWDVQADPSEAADLAAERPEVVERLRRIRRGVGVPPIAGASAADPEIARRLEALGYVSGGGTSGEGDLRAFVRTGARWYKQIMTLSDQGRWAEADRAVRRFLEQHPRSAPVWVQAGFIAVGLEDFVEAEARFRRATELDAMNVPARLNLANVYWATQRVAEAERAYRQVLEADPEDFFALYNLGALLAAQGRNAEAERVWRHFLELYPGRAEADRVAATLRRWAAEGQR